MTWKINYFDEDLEEKIFNLPETLLARYLRLTDLMQEHGADLGAPHHLIFRQRIIGTKAKRKGGYRKSILLYSHWKGNLYAP